MHHLSIKIIGSQAMVRAEWHAELDRSEHPGYSLEISDQGGLRTLEVLKTPGELFELHEEIDALARAVREGAPLPITPEEGRRAVMLCLEGPALAGNAGADSVELTAKTRRHQETPRHFQ